MLFSSISPALTENGVTNAQISAHLIVETGKQGDGKMDGEDVEIYANDNSILSDCNTTDHEIWMSTFKNQCFLFCFLFDGQRRSHRCFLPLIPTHSNESFFATWFPRFVSTIL